MCVYIYILGILFFLLFLTFVRGDFQSPFFNLNLRPLKVSGFLGFLNFEVVFKVQVFKVVQTRRYIRDDASEGLGAESSNFTLQLVGWDGMGWAAPRFPTWVAQFEQKTHDAICITLGINRLTALLSTVAPSLSFSSPHPSLPPPHPSLPPPHPPLPSPHPPLPPPSLCLPRPHPPLPLPSLSCLSEDLLSHPPESVLLLYIP